MIDIIVIDIIISTIDMVSANGFTWKDFSTSGFTLANIITMYRFTWASSVSTNRFS